METEKRDNVISERRVKLHVFEPSMRQIWTVVGKGEEHWLAPEFGYCSCQGYYFGRLKDKKPCYHLELVKLAKEQDDIETVIFSDEEYSDFVHSIIDEL